MNHSYHFFPKNKQFWVYHCSLLIVMSVIQLILFILVGKNFLLNTVIQTAWLPLYTFAVLIFRYCYHKRVWQNFSMAKLIVLTLLLSLISAIIMTLVTLVLILPIFWVELLGAEVQAKDGSLLMSRLAYFIFYNSVISLLFISIWAFIYITVAANRKVKESEIRSLRLENSLKEAKLGSLTNQLNPHFLFNSLNNIRFMIYENAVQADEMITAFSEILRYSLMSSQQDKIAIEQELSIIARYIDIMHLQLGSRLDFQLNFSSSCHRCLIPPMTLQILMENAIKHGIENIKTCSQLCVNISNENEKLIMEVCNPVAAATAVPIHGTGTGLKNIKQRLNLLYGDIAQLLITPTENSFTVTVVIPMEKYL